MYRTAEIGSRKAQTLFCYGKTSNGTSLQIVCGCFRGNLEQFEAAVMETHENNEVYRNQYLREIQKVKVLFGLEEREVAHENMEIEWNLSFASVNRAVRVWRACHRDISYRIDGQEYIAEDIGGAIKGNIIDMFVGTEDISKYYGVKYKEIFIKE